MNFVYTKTPERGIEELAKALSEGLSHRTKVVWMLSGGTNVPIAVSVMKKLRHNVPHSFFKNLAIMLLDERYGKVGHKDSNWRALLDAGFDFEGTKTFPVLTGLSLSETVAKYAEIVKEQFENARTIIGQFGIGADGHIAGILPYSRAVDAKDLVFSYDALPLRRITLTPSALLKIRTAYVFVFGEAKREAVRNLRDKNLSTEEQPAQILKKIPKAYLYSDQL